MLAHNFSKNVFITLLAASATPRVCRTLHLSLPQGQSSSPKQFLPSHPSFMSTTTVKSFRVYNDSSSLCYMVFLTCATFASCVVSCMQHCELNVLDGEMRIAEIMACGRMPGDVKVLYVKLVICSCFVKLKS